MTIFRWISIITNAANLHAVQKDSLCVDQWVLAKENTKMFYL